MPLLELPKGLSRRRQGEEDIPPHLRFSGALGDPVHRRGLRSDYPEGKLGFLPATLIDGLTRVQLRALDEELGNVYKTQVVEVDEKERVCRYRDGFYELFRTVLVRFFDDGQWSTHFDGINAWLSETLLEDSVLELEVRSAQPGNMSVDTASEAAHWIWRTYLALSRYRMTRLGAHFDNSPWIPPRELSVIVQFIRYKE
jgi:hypothetical protein